MARGNSCTSDDVITVGLHGDSDGYLILESTGTEMPLLPPSAVRHSEPQLGIALPGFQPDFMHVK